MYRNFLINIYFGFKLYQNLVKFGKGLKYIEIVSVHNGHSGKTVQNLLRKKKTKNRFSMLLRCFTNYLRICFYQNSF